MRKILLLCMALVLLSCKTTKVEPIIETHTDSVFIYKYSVDTVYQSKILRDSVYIKDSTSMRIVNDTVYLERFVWDYHNKASDDNSSKVSRGNDTIKIIQHDSIPVIREVIKTENRAPKWLVLLPIVLGVVVIIFVFKAIKG